MTLGKLHRYYSEPYHLYEGLVSFAISSAINVYIPLFIHIYTAINVYIYQRLL